MQTVVVFYVRCCTLENIENRLLLRPTDLSLLCLHESSIALCMLGKCSCLCCRLLTFFKYCFRNMFITVSNGLDLDQDQREQNATDYIFCCFLRHFLPHQLCKQEHETECGRYHSFKPQTLVPMRRLARAFTARMHS